MQYIYIPVPGYWLVVSSTTLLWSGTSTGPRYCTALQYLVPPYQYTFPFITVTDSHRFFLFSLFSSLSSWTPTT